MRASALAAVWVLFGLGCSSAEQQSASVRFAVEDSPARCTITDHAVMKGVAERGFAVEHVEGAPVSIDGRTLSVGGVTWSASESFAWSHAAKKGDTIVVAIIASGLLYVATSVRGIATEFRAMGHAAVSMHVLPDMALDESSAAIAWEDRDGAHFAVWTGEWSTHEMGGAMDPRIAAVGNDRFLLAWREGTIEQHGARAKLIDANGTPLSRVFDPAPGLEVVRVDAAGAGGKIVVGSLVATDTGLDLVTSSMSCDL